MPIAVAIPIPIDLPTSGQRCAAMLAELMPLVAKGHRIDVIKTVRTYTGLGLKEAKDLCDVLFPAPPKPRDDGYVAFGVRDSGDWAPLGAQNPRLVAEAEANDACRYRDYDRVVVAKVVSESQNVMTMKSIA